MSSGVLLQRMAQSSSAPASINAAKALIQRLRMRARLVGIDPDAYVRNELTTVSAMVAAKPSDVEIIKEAQLALSLL